MIRAFKLIFQLVLPPALFLSGFSSLATEDHHDEAQHHEEEDHHEHGGGKAIGPGKAILEVDEDLGFQLSPEAKNTIGLESLVLGKEPFQSPSAALVYTNNQIGVYRLRDGFFKLVELKQDQPLKPLVKLPPSQFRRGDEVVIRGLDLLRVADIYSTDKSEYGHGH